MDVPNRLCLEDLATYGANCRTGYLYNIINCNFNSLPCLLCWAKNKNFRFFRAQKTKTCKCKQFEENVRHSTASLSLRLRSHELVRESKGVKCNCHSMITQWKSKRKVRHWQTCNSSCICHTLCWHQFQDLGSLWLELGCSKAFHLVPRSHKCGAL